MFGDADGVAVGHFGDGDPAVDCGLQIDVVRADAGRDRELQLRRLRDAVRGQVRRPERLRDHDLGVGQLVLEDRVGAVLVRGDDEACGRALEELRNPSSPETLPSRSPGVKSMLPESASVSPPG